MIGANGIALPNETIIITDELVELSSDPRQLQAVLAHEIAHVEQRHGLKRLYHSLTLMAALNILFSGASDFVMNIANIAVVMNSLTYSRNHERQADQRSFELLTQLDISPKHFADIIRELEGEEGVNIKNMSWARSHPLKEERIRRTLSYKNQTQKHPLIKKYQA